MQHIEHSSNSQARAVYGHCAGQKKGSLSAVCTFFLAGCLAECDASFAPSTPIVVRMGKLCTVFSTFAHTHAHGT